MVEAETSYRVALRHQPTFVVPLARLATMLGSELPKKDQDILEHRLNHGQLNRYSRARLLFALAHVLDARGQYSRAAECLQEANAISLALNQRRRPYSSANDQQVVDGMIAAFERDLFARLAGAGSESLRPVFVFGLPRSGTSLIEQILTSHSLIHGGGELRFAGQLFDALPSILDRPLSPIDCISELTPPIVRGIAKHHLELLAAVDGGRAERIVDKMPDNYLHLGQLAVTFPRAVFIHCRRDLRDVAVSCWMTDFLRIRWANNRKHIAKRFELYCRMMEHWRATLPVQIHDVDYEETVTDLEAVARRLIAACGLEWEPACLAFHRNERPVLTASAAQVRHPVYTRSVARWRNYERELADLFAALPLRSPP